MVITVGFSVCTMILFYISRCFFSKLLLLMLLSRVFSSSGWLVNKHFGEIPPPQPIGLTLNNTVQIIIIYTIYESRLTMSQTSAICRGIFPDMGQTEISKCATTQYKARLILSFGEENKKNKIRKDSTRCHDLSMMDNNGLCLYLTISRSVMLCYRGISETI
jgi:hypothetical protein